MRANIVSVWHFGQGGRGICIIMLALDWAGARHSQSPVTANAGGYGTIMIFGFRCRWSILLTFTDLMAVANAAFQRRRDFGKTRSIPSNHNDCDHNECSDQRKSAFEAGPSKLHTGLGSRPALSPVCRWRR